MLNFKNFKNFTGNTRNASTVEEIDVFFNYLKKYLQSCLKEKKKKPKNFLAKQEELFVILIQSVVKKQEIIF